MGVMISASHQVVAATVREQPWLDRTEVTEVTVTAAPQPPDGTQP
jgi:hypothetical protein